MAHSNTASSTAAGTTSASSALTRSVLVTGATGGLGRAVVRRLAAEGWTVHAGVRRDPGADLSPWRTTADRSRTEGPYAGEIRPVVFDVTDEASVRAAAERIGGRLDALVNSAGLITQGFWEQVPDEALRRQFEVNVTGLMTVTRAMLPALRATGGRVVNIGALSSLVALPYFGPIAASKAALASLSDSLRLELRHQGVTVSLVEPGAMDTEIFERAEAAARADGLAGGPATERTYDRALTGARAALAAQKLRPVDPAVAAVHHALTARRPRARYLVGPDARTLRVLRRLPRPVRDRLLLNALKLGPAAFAQVGA
ncbi:SDR family NAD(P)-dependent oxidoreductase [Actinacidiphila acididurans]|uniref:SDR family NAD(P)-dependent oxidoreductase n=1 Tax=Actinacidiphila acididurans TaxID=2784346 RepID=A0ABS2U4T9_9ACTN|nr:SDR family NAD(P)-dependent oxidoreductase [Actinacidiphila acididurans]MBM9510644.1 SDR family NAD(P)-dependent oxidoreductase [Actinacidiphila acididurans]